MDKAKVALVTGASRGAGKGIALGFAAEGAIVYITGRSKSEATETLKGEILRGTLDETADAITAAGGQAICIECDHADDQQTAQAIQRISDEQGRLDILVNNAATNPYFGNILDTDIAAFDKTVEVNIRGYFFMSVQAGKLMKQSGGGNIVNTASVHGLQPGIGQGIYSITKAAVINMTKAFAKECASYGIRVNALLPGFTKTKFSGALFDHEKMYQSVMSKIPMNRHADPTEMAGTVLYLVSDASSYTTGECIVVDGGGTV